MRVPWPPAGGDDHSAYRAVRVVGAILAAIGIAAFLTALFVSFGDASRLDRFELPLGDAQGIAVDSTGRIYVGSRAYRRLHRYGADGAFDRAWHAEVTLRTIPVRVTRRERTEPERTIVNQGWLLFTLMSPLPAWFVAALGLLLVMFADPDRPLPLRLRTG